MDQQLSLAKLRRCVGLPPITLEDGPTLPVDWQPDMVVQGALARLRATDVTDDTSVPLDLSGSLPANGDCLALALAATLASSTTKVSLRLRECGIGTLGLWGLSLLLATRPALTTLE